MTSVAAFFIYKIFILGGDEMKKRKKFLYYILSICLIFSYFSGCKMNCQHSWNDGEIQYAVSCTTAGKIKYTCKKCGEYEMIIIGPSEHTLGRIETVKAPTETEEGVQFIYCEVCGKVAKMITIPKIK